MKRIISVVSNDICTDNRVHKIVLTLMANGYSVSIIGRKLKKSGDISDRPYPTKRFRLLFNKGPLFYAVLNLRLLFYLMIAKVDIILSNDLDTLPACWLAASIRNKKLVYDSHELFPEVPELVKRPVVKAIWSFIERKLIRKPDIRITVSPSIAEYYKKLYHTNFEVIRNMSRYRSGNKKVKTGSEKNSYSIIYQGALNIGRGIELAISSMQFIDNATLIIAGTGDIEAELKSLVTKFSLQSKVIFTGRLSISELSDYTNKADIGLSIEEELGLNYKFALPNKLFDYLQARIPIIVSDLPEMKSIITNYEVGEILFVRTPEKLAGLINFMLQETIPKGKYTSKIDIAANELCWEKEQDKLISLFRTLKV